MKKIVLLAAAGALALSGCGSSEANHSEEVANGSEGIKPLPQNYNSLSEDEKNSALRDWSEQLSNAEIMNIADNLEVNGDVMLLMRLKSNLSKGRRDEICRMARNDCSQASNVSQCMKISHPAWEVDVTTFGCFTRQ